MVVDSKCSLIITTKQTNRPNVHNTDIVNRNETDQKGVHDERQQSDQHLYLIKGKNNPPEQSCSVPPIAQSYSQIGRSDS